MNTHPIANLHHQIRGAAHNLARRYGATPEDVEQDLLLAILEAYAADPDFLTQSPQTIINYGANRAGWKARKEIIDARRLGLVEDAPIGDDPAAPTLLDHYAPANPWPAVNLRLSIESALAALSLRDRRIAAALGQGYTPREIAPALGCSFKTIYNRMHGTIASALAA